MAQVVNYSNMNIEFEEGPFVLVNSGGYRIEVQTECHGGSCLPVCSIYKAMKLRFPHFIKGTLGEASIVCDWLNSKVKSGEIAKMDHCWEYIG